MQSAKQNKLMVFGTTLATKEMINLQEHDLHLCLSVTQQNKHPVWLQEGLVSGALVWAIDKF